MQILKALILTLLCLAASPVFAQKAGSKGNSVAASTPALVNGITIDAATGIELLCKGSTTPEGYVVAGEMFSDSCNGAAWIVKRKSTASSATDGLSNFSSPTLGRVSAGEPNEAIAPGQCDDFQQKIKSTYNFNPAQFNDAQRAAARRSWILFGTTSDSRAALSSPAYVELSKKTVQVHSLELTAACCWSR